MNKNYSIVKLTNGESIICNVIHNDNNSIVVESPLKLESYSRITKQGVSESLSLVRWMQPFSSQKNFTLQKSSVVINAEASIGLGKYYEFILRKIDGLDLIEPTEDELKQIEIEEEREIIEEEFKKSNITIH